MIRPVPVKEIGSGDVRCLNRMLDKDSPFPIVVRSEREMEHQLADAGIWLSRYTTRRIWEAYVWLLWKRRYEVPRVSMREIAQSAIDASGWNGLVERDRSRLAAECDRINEAEMWRGQGRPGRVM